MLQLYFDNDILLQALVEEPPVHPFDVLQEVLALAKLEQVALEEPQEFYDEQDPYQSGADGDDLDADASYGQPSFQPTQFGGGAEWEDDSFTDAALDDEKFDTSGFDVVQQ